MTEPVPYAEPILAARVWHFSDGMLRSLHNDFTWPADRPAEARCVPQIVVHRWSVNVREDLQTGQPEAALEIALPLPVLMSGISVRFSGNPATMEIIALGEQQGESVPPPHPAHSCGLYALAAVPADPAVAGVVQLWGRVIPAAAGWRAQFARIVALDDRLAAEAYGVPHLLPRDWPPLTDPRQFRPGGLSHSPCPVCGGQLTPKMLHDSVLWYCPDCEMRKGTP